MLNNDTGSVQPYEVFDCSTSLIIEFPIVLIILGLLLLLVIELIKIIAKKMSEFGTNK